MFACPNCGYTNPAKAVLTKVIQTCYASPAQWDAWTADGDYLFLHYRYGFGSVKSERHGYIAEFSYGDDMAGVISLEDFLEKSGLVLAPHAERSWA